MKYLVLATVATLLLIQIQGQVQIGCKSPSGKNVDWFVIITTPQTVHDNEPESGFLYYDSTMKTDKFVVNPGYGNEENNPIGLTIAQVEIHNLQNMVWNDQLYPEWGHGHGSSTKAHSKGYIAMATDKRSGFIMDHSVPKYPFVDDGIITPKIQDSQRNKAQHHFCLSIKGSQIQEKIIEGHCFTNPQVYQNDLTEDCQDDQSQEKFKYVNFETAGGQVKAIYKNGWNRIKNSKGKKVPFEVQIFEEGITPLVQSDIIVQTFGAPSPYPPLCDKKYNIGNSQEMKVKKVSWNQGSDHCKWAYATSSDFACFGDLNRNTYSQTVRGGAFYCIKNRNLRDALRSINSRPDTC